MSRAALLWELDYALRFFDSPSEVLNRKGEEMSSAVLLNFLATLSALVALLVLASGRLRVSSQWRATVTPLASIIGSGFLIVAPLLHAVLGKWALAGMALLTLLAYGIGAVIRYNIRHAEDYVKQHPHGGIANLEALSQWLLGLAYAISVALHQPLYRVRIRSPVSRRSECNAVVHHGFAACGDGGRLAAGCARPRNHRAGSSYREAGHYHRRSTDAGHL